ncbi:hypothetical protein [Hyphomonas sp.]|uniref:hypothetical protein n=1 Tax=Hyphomonas sp. TaxID=87 RepID=UPI00391BBAD5
MAKATYPAEWGLTPLEAAYLTRLRSGKILGPGNFSELHPRVVTDVRGRVRKTMAQLRRKLDPLDVEITTKWHEGWVLGRAARARLTGLLNLKG